MMVDVAAIRSDAKQSSAAPASHDDDDDGRGPDQCCANYGKGHKTIKARACLNWDGTVRRKRQVPNGMDGPKKKKAKAK